MTDHAVVLLKAANYLDEVLADATPGPWVPWAHRDLEDGCRCMCCYETPWAWEVDQIGGPPCRVANECNHTMHLEWGDAAYISAMHPQVGKALAEWLRNAAARWDLAVLNTKDMDALTVAQAILRAAA